MTQLPDISQRNYLIPQEAATVLGVSVATIQKWKDRGILPHKKFGGRIRLDKTAIQLIVKEGATA